MSTYLSTRKIFPLSPPPAQHHYWPKLSNDLRSIQRLWEITTHSISSATSVPQVVFNIATTFASFSPILGCISASCAMALQKDTIEALTKEKSWALRRESIPLCFTCCYCSLTFQDFDDTSTTSGGLVFLYRINGKHLQALDILRMDIHQSISVQSYFGNSKISAAIHVCIEPSFTLEFKQSVFYFL